MLLFRRRRSCDEGYADLPNFVSAEAKATSKGVKLILPSDVVLADKFAAGIHDFFELHLQAVRCWRCGKKREA